MLATPHLICLKKKEIQVWFKLKKITLKCIIKCFLLKCSERTLGGGSVCTLQFKCNGAKRETSCTQVLIHRDHCPVPLQIFLSILRPWRQSTPTLADAVSPSALHFD